LSWHTTGTQTFSLLDEGGPNFNREQIMNDEKWIVSDKDHLGGKPRVQGTRISVAFLLECLASGMSVAEIVDAYPTLTEDAVQGALRELAHEKEAAAA
jgi:uncharacterized protein (DUF433 family)